MDPMVLRVELQKMTAVAAELNRLLAEMRRPVPLLTGAAAVLAMDEWKRNMTKLGNLLATLNQNEPAST